MSTTTIPKITKEAYYTGQLLKVADFMTEQDFHIQHREFQTKEMFSAGLLSGLVVANPAAKTITITSGAAIDDSGKLILLGEVATYKGQQMTLSNSVLTLDLTAQSEGSWQLTIQNNFIAVTGTKNQEINSPLIALVAKGSSIAGSILLAEIEVSAAALTLTNKSTNVQVRASRLPQQDVANLNASVITAGVFKPALIPELHDLLGKLTATQLPTLTPAEIPELQNLTGKLTASQLPADITDNKLYLTFFVDQPVVKSGTSVKLSWASENGVDGLSLAYLDGDTIKTLETSNQVIKLNEDAYPLTPSQTTTYTLTAQISAKTVAQIQLTVTVLSTTVSINAYASQLKAKGTNVSAAVSTIASKYALTTYSANNAKSIVVALHSAGYDAFDSISEVATYYTQSTNWTLMASLAGDIQAPTPTTISTYIQGLASPVPGYLTDDNFVLDTYETNILTSVVTPVGNKYFDKNLSAYTLYCFANGVYTARANPGTVTSWNTVVSSVILDYYTQVQKIQGTDLPKDFPSIMTDATS